MGYDEFMDMLLELLLLVHDLILVMFFMSSSHVTPFRDSCHFLMIALVLSSS
jgi:hypothetical protein